MTSPDRTRAETPNAATPGTRVRRWVRLGLKIVPPVMLIAAGWVLWREFHKLSWSAVRDTIDHWGFVAVSLALLLSATSFLLMGLIEWTGLRWTGAKVPLRTVALGSFLANGIAHAVGANLLTSSAVRARTYARHGVSLTQVAAATAFDATAFGVGIAALSGGGLLLASSAELDATAITPLVARCVGTALVAGALGYVALCAFVRRSFRIFGRNITLPDVWDALAQLVLGVVDNGVAAAILWVLLPKGDPSYLTFIGAFALSAVVGLLSSVPGGAGVFEGTMMTLLPQANTAALAAAFLGYRLAYYLLPLALAAAVLAIDAIRHRKT